MLARSDGAFGPFDMKMIGQGDINRVNGRIVQEGLITSIKFEIGLVWREIFDLTGGACHAKKSCIRCHMDGGGHLGLGKARCAKNAPIYRGHRALPSR